MIIRIVKLTIDPAKKEVFEKVFHNNKDGIASFDGCYSTELLQDIQFNNVYFTYSKWESEEHLNNYRHSDLFKGIWKQAKETFCSPPKAWSLK